MKKLKFLIGKYFVLCSFGISVVGSAIDSTFEDVLLMKYMENETMTKVLIFLDLFFSVFIFFVGAFIFYRFAKKAIDAESKRQVQEQNLLYSCIAHDLKTPMTSVQGFAVALKEGRIKEEEQGEILDIIYKKSLYMNELIDTLFMYSKLGTNQYLLQKKETNLCVLVRDLAAIHYSEFEDRKMELRIEIPEEEILCELDEKEFRRGIDNLIVNAYKHNPKGTCVRIRVYSERGVAFVTIADDGNPIPKELKENMFQPFVCGNDSRTSGKGNGLGLAISWEIIEKHGGKLWMKEQVNGYKKEFVIQMRAKSYCPLVPCKQ